MLEFDVLVERSTIVLREHKHPPDTGVEAIGNWNVDEPVFAADGHGGFGTLLGERE